MTTANVLAQFGSPESAFFRNRIINGDMRIDQRNAGASIVIGTGYAVDRFISEEDSDGAATAQQVSDAPAGFVNSLKWTTTTADSSLSALQYAIVRQHIEGFNTADLAWGTASAKSVTLSFWVKSSLTGTFGGAVRGGGGSGWSYAFTYSISAANTWEYKTVTIPGSTNGTWVTNNGRGMTLDFGLGVGSTYSGTAGSWANTSLISATGAVSVIGTLNATWQITGVQLEVGSVATPFERRPYGTELALCQRYYEVGGGVTMAASYSTTYPQFWYKVTKRATPTVTNSRSVTVATGMGGVSHWYQDSADSAPNQVSWTASAEL